MAMAHDPQSYMRFMGTSPTQQALMRKIAELQAQKAQNEADREWKRMDLAGNIITGIGQAGAGYQQGKEREKQRKLAEDIRKKQDQQWQDQYDLQVSKAKADQLVRYQDQLRQKEKDAADWEYKTQQAALGWSDRQALAENRREQLNEQIRQNKIREQAAQEQREYYTKLLDSKKNNKLEMSPQEIRKDVTTDYEAYFGETDELEVVTPVQKQRALYAEFMSGGITPKNLLPGTLLSLQRLALEDQESKYLAEAEAKELKEEFAAKRAKSSSTGVLAEKAKPSTTGVLAEKGNGQKEITTNQGGLDFIDRTFPEEAGIRNPIIKQILTEGVVSFLDKDSTRPSGLLEELIKPLGRTQPMAKSMTVVEKINSDFALMVNDYNAGKLKKPDLVLFVKQNKGDLNPELIPPEIKKEIERQHELTRQIRALRRQRLSR